MKLSREFFISDASFSESLYGLRRRGVKIKLKRSHLLTDSGDEVHHTGLHKRQKVLSVAFLVVLPYFKSKLQSIYNREREASLQASLWGDSDERFDNDYISGGNNSFGPRDSSNVEASARARCITRLRKIVGACYPWLHAENEGLSRVLENWLLTMKVENCMLVISNLHLQKH